jgi:L-ectoine synthase
MIVRSTAEITGTDRDVSGSDGAWRSKRIVLGGDGVGFSFHETTIAAGTVNEFHYANHIEAVWLIEGEGKLVDLDNDRVYDLGPGSMYLLDGNERHRVEPRTEMRMMCVFNPPVTGREVHDENGVYPLVAAQ